MSAPAATSARTTAGATAAADSSMVTSRPSVHRRRRRRPRARVAAAVASRVGRQTGSGARSRMISRGLPWAPRRRAGESTRSRPPRTNAMRSHSRSASSRLWVARTIVRPARRSCSMASRTTNAASGSSAAVGSSRKTTAGSWSSARAMASFWRMPLLNVPATSSRRSHSPNSRSQRSMAASRAAASRPYSRPKKSRLARADSGRTGPGVSVRMPTRARTSSGRSRMSKPSTVGRALARLDERGQHPDGRRLARAVGAEQAEDLAAADVERHVADGPAIPESAAQPDGVEGRGRRRRSRREVCPSGATLAGVSADRSIPTTLAHDLAAVEPSRRRPGGDPRRPCAGPGQPHRRAHRLQRRLRPARGHRPRASPSPSSRPTTAGSTLTLAATAATDAVDLDAIGERRGDWIDYVAGTAWAMTEAGLPDQRLPRPARLRPAGRRRAVVVRGARAGRGLGPVRRRAADARPDGHGPDRPARRERVRRGPVRADGPVRRRRSGSPTTRSCSTAARSSTGRSPCRPGRRLVICHCGVPARPGRLGLQRPPRRVRPGRRRARRRWTRPSAACATSRPTLLERRRATGSTTSPTGGRRHVVTENARVLDSDPRPSRPATSTRSARRSRPATPRCATTSRSAPPALDALVDIASGRARRRRGAADRGRVRRLHGQPRPGRGRRGAPRGGPRRVPGPDRPDARWSWRSAPPTAPGASRDRPPRRRHDGRRHPRRLLPVRLGHPRRASGSRPGEIGLITSAGAIGFTIAVPAWGHLADVRLGRPRTLQVCALGGGRGHRDAPAAGPDRARRPGLRDLPDLRVVVAAAGRRPDGQRRPRPRLRPGPHADEPGLRGGGDRRRLRVRPDRLRDGVRPVRGRRRWSWPSRRRSSATRPGRTSRRHRAAVGDRRTAGERPQPPRAPARAEPRLERGRAAGRAAARARARRRGAPPHRDHERLHVPAPAHRGARRQPVGHRPVVRAVGGGGDPDDAASSAAWRPASALRAIFVASALLYAACLAVVDGHRRPAGHRRDPGRDRRGLLGHRRRRRPDHRGAPAVGPPGDRPGRCSRRSPSGSAGDRRQRRRRASSTNGAARSPCSASGPSLAVVAAVVGWIAFPARSPASDVRRSTA